MMSMGSARQKGRPRGRRCPVCRGRTDISSGVAYCPACHWRSHPNELQEDPTRTGTEEVTQEAPEKEGEKDAG